VALVTLVMPRTPIFGLEEVEPFPVPKRPAMMQQTPSVKIPLKPKKRSTTCGSEDCQVRQHYFLFTCWWRGLEGVWLQTNEHRRNNHQLIPRCPPWWHSASPRPQQPLPPATPTGLSQSRSPFILICVHLVIYCDLTEGWTSFFIHHCPSLRSLFFQQMLKCVRHNFRNKITLDLS